MPSLSISFTQPLLTGTPPAGFLDRSTALLLGSNILTILLALFQGWDASTLVWTYFLQSTIIGIFTAIKLFTHKNISTEGVSLKMNGEDVPKNNQRSFLGFFFVFHYGVFHIVYAVFLFMLLGMPDVSSVMIGAAIFLINHLISFIDSKEEFARARLGLGSLLILPYLRIIPMHFTLILMAFVIKDNRELLVLFLLLKTVVDIILHVIQHSMIRRSIPSSTPSTHAPS